MPHEDLQAFIKALRSLGEIREIREPVSPRLEISEIADRVVKTGGPALLFTNVSGSRIPVLINSYGTEKRMALALGAESLDAVASEVAALLEPEIPTTLLGKLKMLPQLARLGDMAPEIVDRAACQEVVITDNPSMAEIPIITCWPGDGGPYITLPAVVTRHPERGTRNLGMYRLQVFDDRTLGMHWQLHKGGAQHFRKTEERQQRMEVAIALGTDPVVTYAASAPLPPEMDELMLAGFLRKKKVPLVRCKTIDMEVPASAQIVLEGYVDPSEKRKEGPFGDHTGYYSLEDDYPVFHLTAVTRRKDPIYSTIIVGPPPMEDQWLGKATERIFLPVIRKILPEVVDINLPVEGIFHNLALVSIDKKYPGHARKVMNALWGLGQMMFTKVIVVVDKDCDVQNPGEVVWKVGTHIDPGRDVVLGEGPVDVLDFAVSTPAYGGKMGIDATKKLPEEGFRGRWPDVLKMSEEVKRRIDSIWDKLGI
ncbi:MAG: menaquinone biosynthesis decarboxylase [Acidobacteria bacterium]|nr:menaquinone biosynthesis decarboxylase [Acidobacteriota bacterium]